MENMNLIGFYSFSTKDKSKTFYIIQLLTREVSNDKNNFRGHIVNSFVTADEFKFITEKFTVGDVLKVKTSVNFDTNKLSYHVILEDR